MFADLFHNLGIADAFAWLAEQITAAEPWQQVLLLMLAGAIPFIESYVGSFLGVLLGVSPWLAIPAAIAGNLIATLGLVLATSRTRTAILDGRAMAASPAGTQADKQPSKRRRKIALRVERFGVPGVSLIGPVLLAGQITAPAMVAIGADRRSVLIWQTIAITAWGVAFGLFGEVLIQWFNFGG